MNHLPRQVARRLADATFVAQARGVDSGPYVRGLRADFRVDLVVSEHLHRALDCGHLVDLSAQASEREAFENQVEQRLKDGDPNPYLWCAGTPVPLERTFGRRDRTKHADCGDV